MCIFSFVNLCYNESVLLNNPKIFNRTNNEPVISIFVSVWSSMVYSEISVKVAAVCNFKSVRCIFIINMIFGMLSALESFGELKSVLVSFFFSSNGRPIGPFKLLNIASLSANVDLVSSVFFHGVSFSWEGFEEKS